MQNLIKNIASLSLFQMLHYLIPLIVLPYVIRVLGPEKYGLVNIAQSLAWYFVLFVAYGFEISASRKIALVQQYPQQLQQLFQQYFYSKVVLLGIAAFVYFVIITAVAPFRSQWLLYSIFFLMIAGYALFPNWFYLGIQKYQRLITIYTLVRALSIVGIFLLVKSPAHYEGYAWLLCGSQLLAGIISLWMAIRQFKLTLQWPGLSCIRSILFEAYPTFIITVIGGIMSSTFILILGLVATDAETGYFAAGVRIVQAAIGVSLIPISQIFLPKIALHFNQSYPKGVQSLRQSVIIFSVVGIMVGLIQFLLAPLICYWVLGSQFNASIGVLRVLALIPVLNGLNNTLGNHGMLNLGLSKQYMAAYIISLLLGTVISIPLCRYYAHVGAAWGYVLAELITLIALLIYLVRKRQDILPWKPLPQITKA
ncbi:MAG TPA: oligosaccharide flippase family protein [Phnomibacter sp.]|nr:oligosaccharide flippase family protein [Phnomibacter sp.]